MWIQVSNHSVCNRTDNINDNMDNVSFDEESEQLELKYITGIAKGTRKSAVKSASFSRKVGEGRRDRILFINNGYMSIKMKTNSVGGDEDIPKLLNFIFNR